MPDPRDLAGVHITMAESRNAYRFLAPRMSGVSGTFTAQRTVFNRYPTLLETADGFLNIALVRNGIGPAVPEDLPECADELLAAENAARAAGTGIWGRTDPPFLPAGNPEKILAASGFQIVRGRIRSTGKTRSATYLNFGPAIKKDFSVMVSSYSGQDFNDLLAELEKDAKRLVEVRGVVENYDGAPRMRLTSPYNIRLLEEAEQ